MIQHLAALSVHAFYAGELDAGRRSCERLLSLPGLPQEMEMQTRVNRTFYTQPLEELAGCRFVRLDVEPAQPGWSCFNPTIADAGGLVAVVRSSNYRIVDGAYVMPAEDGDRIRTQNLLVRLRPDLTVADCRPIAGPEYHRTEYPVEGLEDCRLRHTQTGLGVSATVRDAAPLNGDCRIGIADLDVDRAEFTGLRMLDCLSLQQHEKNWMPLQGTDAWLYAANHAGHTVTVDADNSLPGAYLMHRRSPAPHIASQFRGGSQLVEFRGGWLGLIHEVAHGGHRVYEHRWVWLDNSLTLKRWSLPFVFRERQAIEFAAGLAITGSSVVASFGVRDAEAWLVCLDAGAVEGMLADAAPADR
jgi:hypothetical protein